MENLPWLASRTPPWEAHLELKRQRNHTVDLLSPQCQHAQGRNSRRIPLVRYAGPTAGKVVDIDPVFITRSICEL